MSLKSLTPHLAETIPWVASILPWLLVLMGLMVVAAFVAAFSLIRYSVRLTAAEARSVSERLGRDFYRDFARYLWRGRLTLNVVGLLGMLVVGVLSARHSLRWDWIEFLVVIYSGLWAPFYVTFLLLARAFDRVANRMERLLHAGPEARYARP